MRRKNFTFNSQEGQYISAHTRVEKLNRNPKSYAPGKVVSIITAFEEEDVDPREVAKQEGFADHKEMAEYMKNKNAGGQSLCVVIFIHNSHYRK